MDGSSGFLELALVREQPGQRGMGIGPGGIDCDGLLQRLERLAGPSGRLVYQSEIDQRFGTPRVKGQGQGGEALGALMVALPQGKVPQSNQPPGIVRVAPHDLKQHGLGLGEVAQFYAGVRQFATRPVQRGLLLQSATTQAGRGFIVALVRSFDRAVEQLRRLGLRALRLGGMPDDQIVAVGLKGDGLGKEAESERQPGGQIERAWTFGRCFSLDTPRAAATRCERCWRQLGPMSRSYGCVSCC